MISYRKQNQISTSRSSGILLHITSLPSLYGIGDLGSSAINFIDYLSKLKKDIIIKKVSKDKKETERVVV